LRCAGGAAAQRHRQAVAVGQDVLHDLSLPCLVEQAHEVGIEIGLQHLLGELRLGPAELGEIVERAKSTPEIWDEISADSAVALLDEKLLDLEDYLK